MDTCVKLGYSYFEDKTFIQKHDLSKSMVVNFNMLLEMATSVKSITLVSTIVCI